MVLSNGHIHAPIVEVEAYLGLHDKAAHASKGITPRTRVIFGPPGRAYVYLIYGIHHCLNIVAQPDGTPGCVLIRAVHGISGPGRLTRALQISLAHNALPVFDPASPFTVQDHGLRPSRILVTPRIGITQATDWPLRFLAQFEPPTPVQPGQKWPAPGRGSRP
jgi:DNA-3-methyladenine glycosylase